MHMADALLSPAVGGTAWVAAAGLVGLCSRKLKGEMGSEKMPMMAALAAFVFAAQMINFTIPGTGSSGHIGGGMLLAILLGPCAGFLSIASVLIVQALFFADGGLLALGCNIFNLGFFPCFLAYPFIYRKIAGSSLSSKRIGVAAVIASVVALQLGSFAVVLQTVASGISELPFSAFLALMQPIHLGIGLVEGLATAATVLTVWKMRPEVFEVAQSKSVSFKTVAVCLAAAAVLTGGVFSWFASSHPDGLEWSIGHVAGVEELEAPATKAHAALASLQEKTSVMPDYDFAAGAEEAEGEAEGSVVSSGTSLAGLVGSVLVAALVTLGAVVFMSGSRRSQCSA